MRLRAFALGAAGIGSVALVGCGAPQAVTIRTAANVQAASSTGSPNAEHRCDDGAWTGRYDPDGRPDNLDAGDVGAVYVWHDADGWHVRATDMRRSDHHYTGSIHLDPASANITGVRTVRDEKDDRVFVDGTNTLHYDFHTYASIDGVDFTVSCHDNRREHESLAFRTAYDGNPVAGRVRIGDLKSIPAGADFAFRRAT